MEYLGGDDGVEGSVFEDTVSRSVSILTGKWVSKAGRKRAKGDKVTHSSRNSLAFSYKYDILLY